MLFDAHYSAQVLEVATGERYVVDSWFLANGYRPVIQPVDAWGRKEPVAPPTAMSGAALDAVP